MVSGALTRSRSAGSMRSMITAGMSSGCKNTGSSTLITTRGDLTALARSVNSWYPKSAVAPRLAQARRDSCRSQRPIMLE